MRDRASNGDSDVSARQSSRRVCDGADDEAFERLGGFASGDWRANNNKDGEGKQQWRNPRFMSDENHTLFIDNLPTNVSKRDLYKEFGKDGYITNRGAMKAVERLNGTFWGSDKFYVTMSKFRRNESKKIVVMDKLWEKWKDHGEIECRDICQYRCLITFDSSKVRDAEMKDHLLQSLLMKLNRIGNSFGVSREGSGLK
ncbi:hypothetical protein PIB30_012921 [Stylosanthes scabra]|uniref:RRM domain-containing protein n=1 Tax=Stylosanthes scabra TaxID=79078 RepID=A0ABU6Y4F7_9FABA|nr:hypothetical protein [Stylosanthes scabra]